MHNIDDFKLETEILPLFDFSLNSYTSERIKSILNNPLASVEQITHRQKILQAYKQIILF